MSEFINHISREHGEEPARLINTFFDASNLPLPREDSYFFSMDSGLLVFLDEEACVIRLASAALSRASYLLRKESFVPTVHSDILQPIGHHTLDDFLHLEIMPGVSVGTTKQKYIDMTERLKRDRFEIADRIDLYYRNGGELPDGTPVIIDRGAVTALTMSVQDATENLSSQKRYFGSLTEAFNQAWPKYSREPKKDLLSAFWDMCRQKKDSGILVTGWHGDFQCNHVTYVARKYQQQRLTHKATLTAA